MYFYIVPEAYVDQLPSVPNQLPDAASDSAYTISSVSWQRKMMLFYKWWKLKIRKEKRLSACVDASILDHEPSFVAGLALLHNRTFDKMVGGLCKASHHV